MRVVITRVLPVPAPARTSSGPSVVETASRWAGFSDARRAVSPRGRRSWDVGRGRGEGAKGDGLYTMPSPRRPQSERARVTSHGDARRLPVTLRDRRAGVLVVSRYDPKRFPLAIGLEVHPPDEVLAGQHGQAVVAVESLRRRLEDLEQ